MRHTMLCRACHQVRKVRWLRCGACVASVTCVAAHVPASKQRQRQQDAADFDWHNYDRICDRLSKACMRCWSFCRPGARLRGMRGGAGVSPRCGAHDIKRC